MGPSASRHCHCNDVMITKILILTTSIQQWLFISNDIRLLFIYIDNIRLYVW